jgi:hypothetical protein
MTNKQKFLLLERCSELFQTKRMGHINGPIEPSNSIMGLYELIQKYFNEDFKMAEIGSFHGTSTRFFSLFVDTIYSIDIYDYHVPPSGRIPEMDKMFKEAEEIFLERTKDYNNIVKIKKNSVDAAKEFEDNSLDCVYIDGEHLYDYIRSDIYAWKDKIKDGGVLCGHDFDHNHSSSITKILNEFNLMNEFSVYSDTSWSVIIKRS